MFALISLALAGPIQFTTTPGAEVEVLPMSVAGRVEVIFHRNRVDLRPQLGDEPIDGLRAWRLSDLGGEWVLTAWMWDPKTAISLSRAENIWTAVNDFDAATLEMRTSSGGKYLSVTCTINATSRVQLDDLYRDLSSHPMVALVL